jgi:hypothetical protein
VTANPTTIVGNGTSTSTITITVVRGIGAAPVAGDLVSKVSAVGSGGATCTLLANVGTLSGTPAGTTNASGQVTVTYTSSASVGFCTITFHEVSSAPTQYASAADASVIITQTT